MGERRGLLVVRYEQITPSTVLCATLRKAMHAEPSFALYFSSYIKNCYSQLLSA